MSRIGNAPIIIPEGVEVSLGSSKVVVSGPKGRLEMDFRPEVSVRVEDQRLILRRINDDRISRSLHGTYRSILFNIIKGVTEGWSKELEMVGVGYRAQGGGDNITVSVGFSHPVIVKAPEGISFAVVDNTKLTVSGIDKILVGQIAANLRKVKPPEVYKGKGIRYAREFVRKKAGKAGKAATGATK